MIWTEKSVLLTLNAFCPGVSKDEGIPVLVGTRRIISESKDLR